MTREQYLDCTYREFMLRKRAYERMDNRLWEKFRWVGLKIWEPHLGKKNKTTVYDLFPLPTDPTPEERKLIEDHLKKKGDIRFQDIKKKLTQMGYKV